MMFAILDEQGTVWGMGATETEAATDADRFLAELPEPTMRRTETRTVAITGRQADAIERGVVGWGQLQRLEAE